MKNFLAPSAACILLVAPVFAQSLEPVDSVSDPSVSRWSHTAGRAFWFDGTKANGGPTFFQWRTSEPRSFVQRKDGTARLQGTIQQVGNSDNRMEVDVVLGGFVASTATVPSGSPKVEGLKPEALRSQGGPVDPGGWTYYRTLRGTLVGKRGLAGWRLEITRRGPAVQLGHGASMDNADYGLATWYDIDFKSRGGNWRPGDHGDINTNLDFDPTKCASLHTFKRGSKASSGALPCSESRPVEFGRTVRLDSSDGFVTLRDEDWSVASTRARSLSENAYVELCFKPEEAKQVSLTGLCFDLARNQHAVTRRVDIRYDENPTSAGDNFRTVLRSMVLPDETGDVRAFRRFCFDLDMPRLRNLRYETKIRIYFWGQSRTSHRRDTYLDGICLEGEGECIPATVRMLGRSGCNPTASLSISAPPALGTTPMLQIRNSVANAPVLMMFSIGCGDGSMKVPGTDCRIWLDVTQKIRFLGKFPLNGAGRADIPLPISASFTQAAGIPVAFQAIVWTAAGDGLSNGLCVSVGCK